MEAVFARACMLVCVCVCVCEHACVCRPFSVPTCGGVVPSKTVLVTVSASTLMFGTTHTTGSVRGRAVQDLE